MAATQIPQTTTVTNHGLLIRAGGGLIIGAITGWDTSHDRTATPVFQFGPPSTAGLAVGGGTSGSDIVGDFGEPYEMVPGNVSNTKLSIKRYDIYTAKFENAFGTNNLEMLTRQDAGITLIETWATPGAATNFGYVYYGCWFTSLGRQHSAEDKRIVMANATVAFSRRRQNQ